MNERENERERDLEWGEITSKKATGKALLLCALSLVSVREKKERERERERGGRTALFSRRTLFARREWRTADKRHRRRHHKQPEIVDRLFPRIEPKEGEIDQKLKRTELFRGDGPVAVFIEQSERFFEFGDLLVREFSRHDAVVVFLCCVCFTRALLSRATKRVKSWFKIRSFQTRNSPLTKRRRESEKNKKASGALNRHVKKYQQSTEKLGFVCLFLLSLSLILRERVGMFLDKYYNCL